MKYLNYSDSLDKRMRDREVESHLRLPMLTNDELSHIKEYCLDRFSPEMRFKVMQLPLPEAVFETLSRGGNQFIIIEQLLDMIRENEKLLEQYVRKYGNI